MSTDREQLEAALAECNARMSAVQQSLSRLQDVVAGELRIYQLLGWLERLIEKAVQTLSRWRSAIRRKL